LTNRNKSVIINIENEREVKSMWIVVDINGTEYGCFSDLGEAVALVEAFDGWAKFYWDEERG
jgi:hypothetical protein